MVAVPEHLRHLRTDRRGLPVPYVNRWGPDDSADRYDVRYDIVIRQAAVFYNEDPTADWPDFTRQCLQRQRECMFRRMCQVCARRLAWGETLLPLSRMSTETITLGGARVPVVTEPWLCPDCALFALTTCPALIRRKSAADLAMVQVTSEAQCRLVVSTGWIEGRYKRSTKQRPAAMWVKAQILVPGVLAASPSPEGDNPVDASPPGLS